MDTKKTPQQNIKCNFKLYNSLDSTNSLVLSDSKNFDHKDVIIAAEQTAGRGRFARKWVSSNKENLYMTIVLKHLDATIANYPLSTITHYTAVALLKTLKIYSPSFFIKWPNDIIFNEKEKISGILCESSIKGNFIELIAVGVGVNLNMSIDEINSIDKPATSLNLVVGSNIDKIAFANLLVENFFSEYDTFVKKGFQSVQNFYSANCISLNKHITVQNNGNKVSGIALLIEDSGEMLIKSENSEILTLVAGDII